MSDAWQPIETAPKDGTEILVCGGTYLPAGRLDDWFALEGVMLVWFYEDGWVQDGTDVGGGEWTCVKPEWWQLPPEPKEILP